MKKLSLLFVMIFAVSSFAVGCGGTPNTPKEEDTGMDQEIEVTTGEMFTNDYMSFTTPQEWEAMDYPETKQVNLQKGSEYILIKAEIDDTGNTAEEMVNRFAETYSGTPAEMMMLGENEFAVTSFELGIPQTMYVTMIDHNKVTITLQGEGLAEDPTVKSFLESITFSF